MDHRDPDPGFAGLRQSLVVLAQPPRARPSQAKVRSTTQRFGSTVKPRWSRPAWRRSRSPSPSVASAQTSSLPRVPAVGPDQRAAAGTGPASRGQHQFRPVAVLDVRRVHRPPPAAAPGCRPRCGACGRLPSSRHRSRAAPFFGRLHRLAVEDGRARARVPSPPRHGSGRAVRRGCAPRSRPGARPGQ